MKTKYVLIYALTSRYPISDLGKLGFGQFAEGDDCYQLACCSVHPSQISLIKLANVSLKLVRFR